MSAEVWLQTVNDFLCSCSIVVIVTVVIYYLDTSSMQRLVGSGPSTIFSTHPAKDRLVLQWFSAVEVGQVWLQFDIHDMLCSISLPNKWFIIALNHSEFCLFFNQLWFHTLLLLHLLVIDWMSMSIRFSVLCLQSVAGHMQDIWDPFLYDQYNHICNISVFPPFIHWLSSSLYFHPICVTQWTNSRSLFPTFSDMAAICSSMLSHCEVTSNVQSSVRPCLSSSHFLCT